MKRHALLLTLAIATASAHAADTHAQRQDANGITQAVEAFLRNQTSGMAGEVVVRAGPIDPRLNLAACSSIEPFMTAGSRVVGSLTIGVRCTAPSTWTVYVPAVIKVMSDVIVSVRPLAHGDAISASDLAVQRADLGQLPAGVITDAGQVIGKTAGIGIMPGQPLRQDMLRSPPVVLPGQSVKLVSRGQGFQVSSEGKALGPAAAGQVAQVRIANGQVISGIARPGAIVEVAF